HEGEVGAAEGDETEIPSVVPAPKHGTKKGTQKSKGAGGPRPGKADWPIAVLHIQLGKRHGLRPADVVGAVTNGAGLEGRAVGAVRIGDRESTIEVPAAVAREVVRALNRGGLRGHKNAVKVQSAGKTKGGDR